FLSRNHCARKVRITSHVFDPGWPGLRPDSARQAHAGRKCLGMSDAVELVNLSYWSLPSLHAPQQVFVLVNSPNGSYRPAEALTDSLQDPRSSVGQRGRLSEHPSHRVLRSQARLFALSFCDICCNRVD